MRRLFNTLIIPLLLWSCEFQKERTQITPGVSSQLAQYRKSVYSDIGYDLFLNIPPNKSDPIQGEITIGFVLNDIPDQDLILDFNVDSLRGHGVKLLNSEESVRFINEHLVISSSVFKSGKNAITLSFTAGALSLNRNEDYLYTLFVPDRASTAFPCFDQPDLKAKFTLTLEIPESWKAVSNYSLRNSNTNDGRTTLNFNQSAPIPTYLIAFAAGDFKLANSLDTRMPMTMYYRETDSVKVARNTSEIFDLHQKSIDWMEEYTGINYPFEKFDFALIPPFQYGGMEHPGSIFYRERSLFLDESATINDKLGRASLIAHETAHIWFGDLVTMKWFNDVWSKEVFANFMADKIVNPSFPQINHDLKFLLRLHPSAYSVDRTKGANAIRQPLANLKNAGLMYGPIIYQKAPVMMKHLETLTGEQVFQEGMQEYLSSFAYDNADWNDLIRILDGKTDRDLQSWSNIWIEQPGMPVYELNPSENGVTVRQEDPMGKGRIWMQQLQLLTDSNQSRELYLETSNMELNIDEDYNYALINGSGIEYGSFLLDNQSTSFLLKNAQSIDDEFLRGRVWLNLYETFLSGRIASDDYLRALLLGIESESNSLILNNLLGQLRTLFWRFSSGIERTMGSGKIEQLLESKMASTDDLSIKVSLYRTYTGIFLSQAAWEKLYKVWRDQEGFMGITLSNRDYTSLALELAIRSESTDQVDQLINGQLASINNPDEQKRLSFIRPALSPDQAVRDNFFESLKDPSNRENEPWVLQALRFLHHPLRHPDSEKYIAPSLEMVGEIQLTGDIFFPGRWLDVSLGSYQSEEVLNAVQDFLDSESAKDLNSKLKLKILVASDLLNRAVEFEKATELQ